MTIREATDCFVYDPHQWLNQGCVAISDEDGTLGEPLNKKGKIMTVIITQSFLFYRLIEITYSKTS